MDWIKGLKILLAEETYLPGGIAPMYYRGNKQVQPAYWVDSAVRKATSYTPEGQLCVVLTRLPKWLINVFPSHTYTASGEQVAVRAGGLLS